ncbi:MAG: hypothetical protein KFH87_11100 [Bacteroidetes bacterium]|nr:hypothetical protein [Bacteroidota bacterium]
MYDLAARRLLILAEGLFDQGNHTVAIPVQELRSGTYLLLLDYGSVRRHALL